MPGWSDAPLGAPGGPWRPSAPPPNTTPGADISTRACEGVYRPPSARYSGSAGGAKRGFSSLHAAPTLGRACFTRVYLTSSTVAGGSSTRGLRLLVAGSGAKEYAGGLGRTNSTAEDNSSRAASPPRTMLPVTPSSQRRDMRPNTGPGTWVYRYFKACITS